MTRRRALVAAALTAVVAAMIPLTSSPDTTQARWHQSVSTTFDDGLSDPFTSAAADLPSPRASITNNPAVQVTNTSERHNAWVNVQNVAVRAGALGGQALANDLGVRYNVSTPGGTCAGSITRYWDARNRGAITLGTTYSRPQTRVGAAVLAPTQGNQLCVELFRTLGDRDFLLQHAGRDLVARSNVAMRSEAPATWESGADTVDSRYLVTFPRATPRNDNFTTLSNSCSNRLLGVQLRWAWPDAGASSDGTSSPAVYAWEIWNRPVGASTWGFFDDVAGSRRLYNTGDLNLLSDYEFKVIARLDPAGTYWVEGTHIIRTRSPLLGLVCNSVRVNDAPNPGGPVVLP